MDLSEPEAHRRRTPTDAERFVEHWTEIWREFDTSRFPELFHPEGTLFHPTMREPITSEQEPVYMEGLKALIPDLMLRPTRWGATEDGVLIEWKITGTLAGEPYEVVGADRFTLRGDRAIEGIAYFDTYPIWARLDPGMRRDSTLSELTAQAAGRVS
jgi:ketosteroid isomerase-like protein